MIVVEEEAAAFAMAKAARLINEKYYFSPPCVITNCRPLTQEKAVEQHADSSQPQASPTPERYAYVKLWHPRVPLQVSVPLAMGKPLTVEEATGLMASVDNLLAAGWLPNEATLGEGEQVETIHYAVLSEKQNRNDGSVTPLVFLYHDDNRFPSLTVYLDTIEEQKDFEAVSGLKLSEMQPYIGQGKIERGKDGRLDALVYKAAQSFRVVHKPNPKYDPEEKDPKKKKPRRIFDRWADLVKAPPPAATPAASKPAANGNGRPQQLPTSAAPNAQKGGGKSWNNSTVEERKAAIMLMTDFMKLSDVVRFAGKQPIHESKVYLDAVRDRAFELFRLALPSAESESAIKDILDAVKTESYGKFTEQQMRDLTILANNTRQFLMSKAGAK